MNVSVIIPTYQGVSKIMNVIHALEKQTFSDFEIVIVIDGSVDGTYEVLQHYPFRHPFNIIINPVNTGRAGARNEGARRANGYLLIFYDDDMVPDPDSVRKHVIFHQSPAHSSSLLTGYTPQFSGDSLTDFERYRTFITELWIAPYPDRLTRLARENLFVTTQNFSLRKELFNDLKFDERLTDAEDRELGIRAFKMGIPLFFDRENVAWHHENLTCRHYIRRLRAYAKANKMVNAKHPEFQLKQHKMTVAKSIVYRILAAPFVVWLIDRFNVLLLVPRFLRYKFYAAVTFALSEVYPETKLE